MVFHGYYMCAGMHGHTYTHTYMHTKGKCIMRTALQVLEANKVPGALYEGQHQKAINALARALDPEWKAPPTVSVELVHYTPKGKGNPGMFLKIQQGTYGGVFHRICDGDKLSDEGRKVALDLLTGIANQAADLVEAL